ncbi:hypothetical protein Pla123a_10310 [Posidoniimonas polymericola]|uniref:Uncharacterized protein n=1 Tax=Posidoniimonas polymericola TaxID=2528002 RepID=A0A5C5YTW1_9BACT|nr:hypothetical protein [Posidoniimonas polymericola]TWT78240.1 hypothetical protein Pla123a_10310 [Posidoniimonas polymericola]
MLLLLASLLSQPLLAETRLWYAAPLIVSVSLVFSATRHERPDEILTHALRFGGWVLVFMAVVTFVMQFMAWLQ